MSRGLQADLHVEGRVRASLDARPGEIVAIIGPNGAGKTSLLRALAGLVEVEGTALLDGEDLLHLPVRERRVGLVFQERLLFPHLSALENVAFGPRSRGLPRHTARERASAWLDRMGIGELADRRPGALSGGQAQRVAIARALVTEPRLLLLDEPFAGLDVGVAATLRHELAEHLADFDGVTLIVTHDPVDALTLADQVVVLDRSSVVQVGPPAEVAARPHSEHVARLVGLNLVRHEGAMLAFRPDAVAVSLSPPEGSPRLRWHGPVTGLTTHGDAVRLHVAGPADLLADVTAAAVAELGLRPGLEVWLAVKATAVERYEAADNIRP